MTDKKKILQRTLIGVAIGFLLGLVYVFEVAENFDWGNGVLYGFTGGIGLGLLCLTTGITATKIRNKKPWLRRLSLIVTVIGSAIIFFPAAYMIVGIILGLTIWRNP